MYADILTLDEVFSWFTLHNEQVVELLFLVRQPLGYEHIYLASSSIRVQLLNECLVTVHK